MMGKANLLGKQNKGFSLVEVMIVVGISSILLTLFAVISTTMSKSIADSIGNADVASYRTELKAKLRSLEKLPSGATTARTHCMAIFNTENPNPLFPQETWEQIVRTGGHLADRNTETLAEIEQKKRNFKVELPNIDLLTGQNTPVKKYGDLFITRTYLNGFTLVSEKRAFTKDTPGEFDWNPNQALIKQAHTYLVQAELHVELSKKQNPNPTEQSEKFRMMPLRLNFAVQKVPGQNPKVMACDYRSLAEVVAPIQVCEALGPEFVYVYDNFSGPGTGQCYAAKYDPNKPPNSFSLSDYQSGKVAQTTGYSPIRQFFCEFAYQGRGMEFRFCTGAN